MTMLGENLVPEINTEGSWTTVKSKTDPGNEFRGSVSEIMIVEALRFV